jgi:hypothetical protein
MSKHVLRASLNRRLTVSTITITKEAEDSILKAARDPAADGVRQGIGNIPLLLWSHRSYSVSNSGEKTEFGSRFYFYWTNRTEIETSKYAITFLSSSTEIALAPGELFRTGSHQIDLHDGKLILEE